jgi:DNA replication protein DnaC
MKNPFAETKYQNACLSNVLFDGEQADVVTEFIQNPKGFLYIHSKTGVGKTYFCAAVTNLFLKSNRHCWYQNEVDFMERLYGSVDTPGKSSNNEIKIMTEQDFLIYDDLGSMTFTEPKKMEWHRNSLFALIDGCGNKMTPMIITSNYSPDDLGKVFHERFVSRINATQNKIIHLKGPDKRTQGL